jgi:hypothetical protein
MYVYDFVCKKMCYYNDTDLILVVVVVNIYIYIYIVSRTRNNIFFLKKIKTIKPLKKYVCLVNY